MKKLLLAIAGSFLILAGVVGLILPLLPGWPLIFVGLLFTAPRAAWGLKNFAERHLSKRDVIYFEEWKQWGVDAGITTRRFPVLLKSTEALTLEAHQRAFKASLSGSTVLVSQKVSLSGNFIFLNQVHGDRIEIFESAPQFSPEGFLRVPEADGVLTCVREASLLAFTADCLSVFFCAVSKKSEKALWIGAVHAGWRGTEKKISQKMYELIKAKSGCGPEEIYVILGPCISTKHYEVGKEFKKIFPASSLKEKRGKLYFDLFGENKRQLLEAGLPENNVSLHWMCTVEENKNFFSFRKEKEKAGRMVSFIQLQKIRE